MSQAQLREQFEQQLLRRANQGDAARGTQDQQRIRDVIRQNQDVLRQDRNQTPQVRPQTLQRPNAIRPPPPPPR